MEVHLSRVIAAPVGAKISCDFSHCRGSLQLFVDYKYPCYSVFNVYRPNPPFSLPNTNKILERRTTNNKHPVETRTKSLTVFVNSALATPG